MNQNIHQWCDVLAFLVLFSYKSDFTQISLNSLVKQSWIQLILFYVVSSLIWLIQSKRITDPNQSNLLLNMYFRILFKDQKSWDYIILTRWNHDLIAIMYTYDTNIILIIKTYQISNWRENMKFLFYWDYFKQLSLRNKLLARKW